jgi:sulfur relay (sulfurtransferase) complex TusBCD TusD component (DsrE family)
MDARGIDAGELVPGSMRGSMEILTSWTREADKVLVF